MYLSDFFELAGSLIRGALSPPISALYGEKLSLGVMEAALGWSLGHKAERDA